ncbi:MAG: hypothetical protein MPN21_23810, partial [Thermoanaerobaculia bacterium]|nr:hypothetical protein [Thermoanaerobaculia bacterium]
MIRQISSVFLVILVTVVAIPAQAGVFFLEPPIRNTMPDAVAHAVTYDGTGGPVTVSLCIDPVSPSAGELVAPVEKAIETLNNLVPTTGNYVPPGESTQVPAGHVDAESIILHEILHCIGLHHGDLRTVLDEPLDLFFGDATFSTEGPDGDYSFVLIGADNFWGSADDRRGDDVNLFWFRKMNNDPFALPTNPPPAYDQTNYTRDLADLPPDDRYTANGTPAVAESLGYPNTKAIMYSQTGIQAEARSLSHDDVTMLRYAMSGLNETEGDADDYVLTLELTDFPCDIPVRLGRVNTSEPDSSMLGAWS